MFIIVKAMGRCVTYLVVIKILHTSRQKFIANKQELRQMTETGTQSARNDRPERAKNKTWLSEVGSVSDTSHSVHINIG